MCLLSTNVFFLSPMPVTSGDGPFGYYGSRLRYAGIRVNLSLSEQELAYEEGLAVMANWEDFFNNEVLAVTLRLSRGRAQVCSAAFTLSINAEGGCDQIHFVTPAKIRIILCSQRTSTEASQKI